MELNDNQFLKVDFLPRNRIIFEIFEVPTESWRRPKRWRLDVSMNSLVNRHTKESKRSLICTAVASVKYGFFSEFYPQETYNKLTAKIDQVLESEFIRG